MRFRQFMENNGYMSYAPLASVIPNVNLAGVTSSTHGVGSYTRRSYGDYDEPKDPVIATLKKDISADLDKLDLPTVKKRSEIKYVEDKKNPIFIFLADGTKLYVPVETYRNIGQPKPGTVLTVTLQRKSDDTSPEASKILKIEV